MVAEFLHRLGPGVVPALVHELDGPDGKEALFESLVHLARRDLRPFREILPTAPPKLSTLSRSSASTC